MFCTKPRWEQAASGSVIGWLLNIVVKMIRYEREPRPLRYGVWRGGESVRERGRVRASERERAIESERELERERVKTRDPRSRALLSSHSC